MRNLVEAGLFITPIMEDNIKVRRGVSVVGVSNLGEDRMEERY